MKTQKYLLVRIGLQKEKRKLYLTLYFLQFIGNKILTHANRQPTTPYTDWIKRQFSNVTDCKRFVTYS